MLTQKVFLLLLLMCISSMSYAKHILSGAMSYECLGNNEYEITMTIFRDCYGGGAPFDDQAPISVYKNGNELQYTEDVSLEILDVVEPIDCDGTPVAYCSEKGIYKFTVITDGSFDPYTIVYQRCCWSEAVANVMNPGEHGITVLTEITPLAQEMCNSQVNIDMPLSFSACPGQETIVPFDGFDVDGDSLVYEICMPLQGGGLFGVFPFENEDPTSCEGVSPDPACPGPYFPLPFATGFDLNNPFPTVDGIHIDQATGAITFTPTAQGIYVYALCVSEYRDGQFLGKSTHNIETTSGIILDNKEVVVDKWEMNQSFSEQSLFFTANTPVKNGDISLFDISGKLVLQKSINNEISMEISTNGLNAGIYFATLKSDQGLQTFKVMVVK